MYSSRFYSIPSTSGNQTWSARFNSSGTRLLCSESDSQLVVYDFPSWQQPFKTGKTLLKASDYGNDNWTMYDVSCFAGIDDELVISGSDDCNMYIWSLPDPKGQQCSVDQPLCVLCGHEKVINCVRCSRDNSTLISCDDSGVIKLWNI